MPCLCGQGRRAGEQQQLAPEAADPAPSPRFAHEQAATAPWSRQLRLGSTPGEGWPWGQPYVGINSCSASAPCPKYPTHSYHSAGFAVSSPRLCPAPTPSPKAPALSWTQAADPGKRRLPPPPPAPPAPASGVALTPAPGSWWPARTPWARWSRVTVYGRSHGAWGSLVPGSSPTGSSHGRAQPEQVVTQEREPGSMF